MQLDIKPALIHYDLSVTSPNAAIQGIRNLVEFDKDATDACSNEELIRKLKDLSPVGRAEVLVKDIFGLEVKFGTLPEAVITIQALIDNALKTEGVVEDPDMALMAAQKRCTDFINKPQNRCMFVTAAPSGGQATVTEQRDFGAVGEIAVEVTKEGKFKKGEKERISEQLYTDWLKSAPDPTNNQEFIKILMDKLGMSKAGATTYNYNLKKKHGQPIKAKVKRA